jgi:hypothetical protein
MLSPQDLFDLSQFSHASIFDGCEFAWDALPRIEDYIMHWFSTVLPPQICGNISGGVAIEGKFYILLIS